MASVVLISDDSVLERGVSGVFEQSTDLHLAGRCVELEHAVQLIQDTQSAVVLIDMSSGITLSAIAELRKVCPSCHVCLWVRHLPDELAYQAMTLGVRGILRRHLPVSDLLRCLTRLLCNEVWFEERLMGGFFSNRVVRLTRRESQLVALLAQGLKNKEIAYALTLSEGTVKVYLSRLFEELAVKDRFELALYGLQHLTAGGPSIKGSPEFRVQSDHGLNGTATHVATT
jgi:DNA-binding NarL/FixJ family response regulator